MQRWVQCTVQERKSENEDWWAAHLQSANLQIETLRCSGGEVWLGCALEGPARVWSWQIGEQGLTLFVIIDGRMTICPGSFLSDVTSPFQAAGWAYLGWGGSDELQPPRAKGAGLSGCKSNLWSLGGRRHRSQGGACLWTIWQTGQPHISWDSSQIFYPAKVGHIGGQGELGELPSLAVGPDGEVLVADSKILVYSEEGVMVSKHTWSLIQNNLDTMHCQMKEIGPRGSLGHPGSPGGQTSTLDRRGRSRQMFDCWIARSKVDVTGGEDLPSTELDYF